MDRGRSVAEDVWWPSGLPWAGGGRRGSRRVPGRPRPAAADALGDREPTAWCGDPSPGGLPGAISPARTSAGWWTRRPRLGLTWAARRHDRLLGARGGARTLLYVWDDACTRIWLQDQRDPAWRVREMCAKVCARWRWGQVDARGRLPRTRSPVRAAAVRVLGVAGEGEHVEPARAALEDPDGSVQRAAVRALRDPGATARSSVVSGQSGRTSRPASAWPPGGSGRGSTHSRSRDRAPHRRRPRRARGGGGPPSRRTRSRPRRRPRRGRRPRWPSGRPDHAGRCRPRPATPSSGCSPRRECGPATGSMGSARRRSARARGHRAAAPSEPPRRPFGVDRRHRAGRATRSPCSGSGTSVLTGSPAPTHAATRRRARGRRGGRPSGTPTRPAQRHTTPAVVDDDTLSLRDAARRSTPSTTAGSGSGCRPPSPGGAGQLGVEVDEEGARDVPGAYSAGPGWSVPAVVSVQRTSMTTTSSISWASSVALMRWLTRPSWHPREVAASRWSSSTAPGSRATQWAPQVPLLAGHVAHPRRPAGARQPCGGGVHARPLRRRDRRGGRGRAGRPDGPRRALARRLRRDGVCRPAGRALSMASCSRTRPPPRRGRGLRSTAASRP